MLSCWYGLSWFMKFLDQRQSMNIWRFIQTINQYVPFSRSILVWSTHTWADGIKTFVVLPCRRHDLTESLKQLQCRTLIFVGENSHFHTEAVHMTAKLDKRYSALVEVSIIYPIFWYSKFDSLVSKYQIWYFWQVQACGSVVTEEQPHAMLIPMEYFLMGYGLFRPSHVSSSPRSPLNPFCISPELLSPESMGVKLKPIKTRANLRV